MFSRCSMTPSRPYGAAPKCLGLVSVACREMMFYHDMPVKLSHSWSIKREPRLAIFDPILGAAQCDFVADFGLSRLCESYVYISAKRTYTPAGSTQTRPGWHTDGFGTDDINYVWCDGLPTEFCLQPFALSDDHALSMHEMHEQARSENVVTYPAFSLLRLDPAVVHRPALSVTGGFRTFVKVSISRDQYRLAGNSHNHMLDYDWDLVPRAAERNDPSIKGIIHA